MPLPITNECNFEHRILDCSYSLLHTCYPNISTFQQQRIFYLFFFHFKAVFSPWIAVLRAIICDPVSSIEESIRHLRDESSCVVVGIEQFSGLLRVVKLSKRWSRILPDVSAVLPDRQDVSVVGLTG